MAKIGELVNGVAPVTVTFLLQESELKELDDFARSKQDFLRSRGILDKDEYYTLDDVVLYIIGEVMSGRGKYLDL